MFINLDVQLNIEDKYSRKNIRSIVQQDIDSNHQIFNDMVQAIDIYLNGKYYTSKQARIAALTMSATELAEEILIYVLPIDEISPIQATATQIAQQLGYEILLDGVKTAAELLAICEISGVYTIYHASAHNNKTGTLAIRPNYSLEPHTETFIKQTKYLPPMVCNPSPWTGNNHGGYLRGSGSVILGHLNHHPDKQALDVINILQSIGWSLNDMVDYEEETKKDLDTAQKQEQFKYMTEESLVVYKELQEHGNKFYFVWKYDKRGRMYSQGYHCNLQGTEYKKAILNFTKEELIQ